MTTARELMDQARQRIEAHPDTASSLGAVYKFVIDGDGGGTFVINMGDNPGVSELDADVDCVIKMKEQDFVEMVETRGDSRNYFLSGKLKVEGDFGLAMKLRKFTDMFR